MRQNGECCKTTNYRAVIIRRLYFLQRHRKLATDPENISNLDLRINECKSLLEAGGDGTN